MESGAKAAISGFRLQALHTLDLILQDASINREFQPEGKEDLAVYENGKLIKAIQVKAYSTPLTLSDLAPRKEGSLLRRLVSSEEKSSILELVSFGPLGPELEAIQRQEQEALESLSSKLQEYGYSDLEIKEIVRRLQIVKVDEIDQRERVYRFFTQTIMTGDPGRAFDLLVWWILQAAEHRRRVTFQGLRDQLLSVGRYLAERVAHHDEWFTTIKPLEEQPDPTTPSIEILAAEYYRGTAARYAHIRAGLDVRRDEQLKSLDSYFQGGKKVVIVHGASGQGKTSLALRYLYEYVPTDWRFMVSAIDDRRHAASIANALANHLRVVNAPIWLFIDVAPRDLQWVALVRELLDIENIRILVAIREEDLARTTASESEIGFPADIRLEFAERDAANVYTKLAEREAVNAFPTFGEAWQRFGGDGPLLEFVYLITQTESLRSVLTTQVRRLRAEVRSGVLEPTALRFLQICATATSFEARVNLAPLVSFLALKDPIGTVALFENEYLLRFSTDRTQVEALHPVRSGLLAGELHDATFAPAEEAALQALPFIPEADLEVFLLYLLSRMPNCWNQLQHSLWELEIKTWTGASGIGRALLWWGVRCYLEENRATLEGIKQIAGDAFTAIILPDVAGALKSDLSEEILNLMETINPKSAEALRRVRSSLTPTQNLLKPLSEWLVRLKRIVNIPSDAIDWYGVSELTFWAGRLGITPPIHFDITELQTAGIPVRAFAHLSLALSEAYPEKQSELLQVHGDTMRIRFREEADILFLREEEQSIAAEFIVNFDLLSGARKQELSDPQAHMSSVAPNSESGNETQRLDTETQDRLGSILNDEAVRRVELLRGLFSHKEQYCTQGHGHQLSYFGVELPHDSTIKHMPPTAMPAPWPVRVNSTLHSLEGYRDRPATWRQFAGLLLAIRETIAKALLQLLRALTSYFEGASARSLLGGTLNFQLWEEAKRMAGNTPHLPKSTVDEWGLSSETNRQVLAAGRKFSTSIASEFYLRQYRPFSKAIHDYMFSISNFFNQSELICSTHGFIGRNPSNRDKVLVAATNLGYDEANIRLSKLNLFRGMLSLEAMQRAFDEKVGSLVKADNLERVRRRERDLFPNLWALWYQFCHFPEKRMHSASAQSLSAMESSILPLREALNSSLVNGNWSATIISEGFSWKGSPTLALRLDLPSLEFLEVARAGIISRLHEIFRSLDFSSLTGYAVQYHWDHILIVPTINGTALEPGAWTIPTILIASNNEESPDRPLWRLLHPLSEEQAAELGIKTIPESRISALDDLLKVLIELQLLFSHLAIFGRRLIDLDDLGIRILRRYLEKLGEQLNQRFGKLQELIPEVLRHVREVSAIKQEMLDILLHPIERLDEEINSYGQKVTIELSDCESKADELQEVFNSVALLRLMTVPGILEAGDLDPADTERP